MPVGVPSPAQQTRSFVRSDKHGISGFALVQNLQDAYDIPAGWVLIFYTIGNPDNAAVVAPKIQAIVDEGFQAVLVLQHRDENNIVYDTGAYASAAEALADNIAASFPAADSGALSSQLDTDLALLDSSISHFVIGNECQEDNPFWQGTLADYTAYYQMIRPLLAAKISGAQTTTCGIADGILTDGVGGEGTAIANPDITSDDYMALMLGEDHDFVPAHLYRSVNDIPAKFAYIKEYSTAPIWITEMGTPDPRVKGFRDDNTFNELNVEADWEAWLTALWAEGPERIFILKMNDNAPTTAFGEMGLMQLVTNRWGVATNAKKRLYTIWREECFKERP